jgi:hypothetical protein
MTQKVLRNQKRKVNIGSLSALSVLISQRFKVDVRRDVMKVHSLRNKRDGIVFQPWIDELLFVVRDIHFSRVEVFCGAMFVVIFIDLVSG